MSARRSSLARSPRMSTSSRCSPRTAPMPTCSPTSGPRCASLSEIVHKDLSVTIDGYTLSRLSRHIRRACRDDHFYALLAPWSCGAFDGGCLIVAEALHQALGTGTLYGLWGTRITQSTDRPRWMHAVLRIGDRYVDGAGACRSAVNERQIYSLLDSQGLATAPVGPWQAPVLSAEASRGRY